MPLKVLQNVPPDQHSVDIVAVHGLNGDALQTWTHPSSESCWIRDWLGTDVPGARVMTFSYNADVFGNSIANILDCSKELLSSLFDEQEDHKERPLVLLAHSLGGIIVKRALNYANTDSRYSSILSATKGIIFFGTPHSGSDKANYGSILANIGSFVTLKPSSKLISALKSNSDELYQITVQFQFLVKNFQIVSFYETRPSKSLRAMIVEKSSSVLNLPDEESIPVDGDHSDICKFENQSSDTYNKCFKRINRMLRPNVNLTRNESKSTSKNVYWKVTRSFNNLFTGRGKDLAHLQNLVKPDENELQSSLYQKRILLSGMGGIGKSEICLRVANFVKDSFWGIFWIDTSTHETVERGFSELAKMVGAPVDSVDDAKNFLANTQHSWLLILDNADDRQMDLSKYFPSGNHGTVLITSRNSEWEEQSTSHMKLDLLDSIEARELLLRTAAMSPNQTPDVEAAADEIVKKLGSHTLAIIQAGTYIMKGLCKLEHYISKFEYQRKQLMNTTFVKASSSYGSVYATFEVSLNPLLSSSNPEDTDALELLEFLSMMHFDGISIRLFELAWHKSNNYHYDQDSRSPDLTNLTLLHKSRLPRFMAVSEDYWDDSRLLQAITVLISCSLIKVNGDEISKSISMHPLTHQWARDRLDSQIFQNTCISAASTLAFAFSGPRRFDHFEFSSTPHTLMLTQSISLETKEQQILVGCGQILLSFGRVTRDLRHDAPAMEIVNKLKAQEVQLSHINVMFSVPIKTLAGQCLLHLEKVEPAIVELEQAVTLSISMFPAEHPFRLKTQHALARAYLTNNQIEIAIQMFQKIVEIRAKTLDPGHPSLLTSQHELARAYLNNNQIEIAIQMLQKIVEIEAKTLDPGHPSLLSSQHELASAYLTNNQIQIAIQRFQKIVEIRAKTLDPGHPSLLTSQHELASAYLTNNQIQIAIQRFQKIVEIKAKTLDPGHPSLLSSQHELARAYLNNNQVEIAIQMLQKIVEIKAKTLDPGYPDLLISQHGLSIAYSEDGQFHNAVALLETVVETGSKVSDSNLLIYKSDLAKEYVATIQREKALRVIREVIEVQKTSLMVDDPRRIGAEELLAELLKDEQPSDHSKSADNELESTHSSSLVQEETEQHGLSPQQRKRDHPVLKKVAQVFTFRKAKAS